MDNIEPETTQRVRLPLGAFPPLVIVPPLSGDHRHTFVLLHGRGSSADKFAQPLLDMPVAAGGPSLRTAYRHARFVFPTAPRMRATLYRRSIIHQWFDGSGDWEETVLGHMGVTVRFLHGLLREEIRLLGGDARRLVLGGLSQGCATVFVGLLLWEGPPLGAVVGMCGFMPIANQMLELLDAPCLETGSKDQDQESSEPFGFVFEEDAPEVRETGSGAQGISASERVTSLLRSEIETGGDRWPSSDNFSSYTTTPVFVGHGVEDDVVDVKHGKTAASILGLLGLKVENEEYAGLGHWYSTDMLGDMAEFLQREAGIKWESQQ